MLIDRIAQISNPCFYTIKKSSITICYCFFCILGCSHGLQIRDIGYGIQYKFSTSLQKLLEDQILLEISFGKLK